jgi:hypothetical protein
MATGRLMKQKVSLKTKQTKDWYLPNFEYYRNACLSSDDHTEISKYFDILLNGIDEETYKEVLNPYQSEDPRFGKLPGNIRNMDIMTPLWERYVGEYIAQYNNFVVTNVHPKAIEEREASVTREAIEVIGNLFMEEFNKKLQAFQQQSQDNPEAQPPQIERIDVQKFIDKARENWGRQQTVKNKRILKLLSKITDAETKYIEGFFYWFVTGRVISYHAIKKGDVYKDIIHPLEYYRYGKGRYIQDDAAGLRKFTMSIEEIEDRYTDDLDSKILKGLSEAVNDYSLGDSIVMKVMEARHLFGSSMDNAKKEDNVILSNSHSITVEHLVWISKTRYYTIKSSFFPIGIEDLLFTEEEYKDVKSYLGSDAFDEVWQDEYYEQYKFGPDTFEIYTKPRPIVVQESDIKSSAGVKSPYNGLYGDILNINSSKVARLVDYQVLTNTFAFQLARLIAKNQGKVAVIPESLLEESENYDMTERLFYMLADSKLLLNDEDDVGLSLKAQMIKALDLSNFQEIRGMIDILEYIKGKAWDAVAMNEERYGNVNPNAGKAVTEQTIFRSSLGSRLTFDTYNTFVATDHEKALNYSRVAYADGRTDALVENGQVIFVTLGNEPETMYDLGVSIKYSSKERENIEMAKQGTFSMFQNDRSDMAIEVLNADSMDEIADLVRKFQSLTQEHEARMEQEKQNTVKMTNDGKMKAIDRDKQWDYKIEAMKQSGEMDREILKLEMGNLDEPEEDNFFDNSIKDRETKVKEGALEETKRYNREQIRLKTKELKEKSKQLYAKSKV